MRQVGNDDQSVQRSRIGNIFFIHRHSSFKNNNFFELKTFNLSDRINLISAIHCILIDIYGFPKIFRRRCVFYDKSHIATTNFPFLSGHIFDRRILGDLIQINAYFFH